MNHATCANKQESFDQDGIDLVRGEWIYLHNGIFVVKILTGMKIVITSFWLILAALTSHAQARDARLLAGFSDQELSAMSEEALAFLNYYVDHACSVGTYEPAKSKDNHIGEVEVKDLNRINIYELNLQADEDQPTYYHIVGTDKLLVVYGMKQVRAQYQSEKNR